MRHILITLSCIACFLSSQITSAQQPDPSLMNDKEYARYCIQNLKEGALVVRLNFKTMAVNSLKQSGQEHAADQIRTSQEMENTVIMRAFTNYFKFCPVYFIAYDSTIAVQKGKTKNVFLDENLKVDPVIQITQKFFLFTENGALETSIPEDKLNPEQEKSSRGLMGEAIVIRDISMKMLRDPFPYYVHLGNWNNSVKKLSKKLQQFYQHNI